jgi:hypothetical protein
METFLLHPAIEIKTSHVQWWFYKSTLGRDGSPQTLALPPKYLLVQGEFINQERQVLRCYADLNYYYLIGLLAMNLVQLKPLYIPY